MPDDVRAAYLRYEGRDEMWPTDGPFFRAFAAGHAAGMEAAAGIAWNAINQAMPDGSWHDAQEVVNTALRAAAKGAGT